ncbi:MAG: c-type cytochrome [Nonlabens sp.]|uniref:c-type cytochrome n=1 Tax=Nonlabens sp. TaxID=1888209 RepID=UPI003EF81E94
MLEPLTKVIAYTFTFMITAVAICVALVLYIGSVPGQTSTAQVAIIDGGAAKPEFTDLQQQGEKLFKANCAACHKLFKRAIGPGLLGVTERYEREWLYSWIKNSQALIASGDADAVKIYNEYNQSNMNSFPQLSNEDIDAILAYTDAYK